MSKSVQLEMWKAMADSPFLMVGLKGASTHSEPMTAQLDESANSECWFYTTKTNRIAKGGPASAQFASKDHTLFASISGMLCEETNPKIIDKYFSKHVAAWYDKGRDDPKLCMIRFDLSDAEIWTVDPTLKGKFKLMVNKKVQPEEVGEHETASL